MTLETTHATVQIRYFAALREALGPQETVAARDQETLAQLRERLVASSPAHAQALGGPQPVRMAVNQVLCEPSQPVRAGDEVAFFPPVTGG